jgi:hypothetical protein
VIAGVDVGNATTEVVLVSGGVILGAGRMPTRGRKGSADSVRGAAALVRRVERQAGRQADEARIAPLRTVDTSVVTVPNTGPPRGRLRVLAAGVATPGGNGACVGAPLPLPAGSRAAPAPAGPAQGEPWVMTADGGRTPLREACKRLAHRPVGTIRVFGSGPGPGQMEVDDLFAVDLAAAAEAATARQGSTGRAVLVASLSRTPGPRDVPHAELLGDLLARPVRSLLSEPAAARLGALTTPGARADGLIVDLGAGTIDVIAADSDVVAAGAGDPLTAAVAETLGIPRAAADWVKRGPCLRVDGDQRFEAEDGSRGFLPARAPAPAAGMLVVDGPGGLLPFDRRHGPGEWRIIRLRLKQAVLAGNFQRAVRTLGADPGQILVVGGPAGDEELLGGARALAARRRGRRPGQRRRHLRGGAARSPLRGRARPGPSTAAVTFPERPERSGPAEHGRPGAGARPRHGVGGPGHCLATRVRTSYVATGFPSWLVTSASQRTSPCWASSRGVICLQVSVTVSSSPG